MFKNAVKDTAKKIIKKSMKSKGKKY